MNNPARFAKPIVLLLIVFLAVIGASCSSSSSSNAIDIPPVATSFSTTLYGEQETANVATPAVGFGSVALSENSSNNTNLLSGGFATTGITAIAAHIHGPAAAGINAPVLIGLTESPAGSGVWVVPEGTSLTAEQITSLKAGELYFNAHTPANRGGEIRGQIGRDVRIAALSGAQEVPLNASVATGKGLVVIDPATKSMTASVTTTGITATVAHIHEEVVGTSGGVVFPLTETAAGSGIWTTTVTLNDAQYTALKSGRYYFNVHSATFGGGEIRGQIGPVLGTGIMSSSQEVTPNTSTASGIGTLAVNPVTLAVSAGMRVTGLTATGAHIHEAAAGANGPVIVPFTEAPVGSGAWSASPTAVLTPAQFASMLAGNLYFNAHTVDNPGGEIRGQISVK
jgi:CHRD domain